MENRLEHKIREAYQKHDSETKYTRKDDLWDRISAAQNTNFGVHAFWRTAAIFLAVFLLTGAFAGGIFVNQKKEEFNLLKKNYSDLISELDSMQSIAPKIQTEIKYVEKEVKVFVPVKVEKESIQKENVEKLSLKNLQLQKKLETEKLVWQHKTDSLLNELIAIQNISESNKTIKKDSQSTNVMELKTEKNKDIIQQPAQSSNPKMKIQLFSDPAENIKFDLNSTLFKK